MECRYCGRVMGSACMNTRDMDPVDGSNRDPVCNKVLQDLGGGERRYLPPDAHSRIGSLEPAETDDLADWVETVVSHEGAMAGDRGQPIGGQCVPKDSSTAIGMANDMKSRPPACAETVISTLKVERSQLKERVSELEAEVERLRRLVEPGTVDYASGYAEARAESERLRGVLDPVIPHPLMCGKLYPASVVLMDLSGQEGCDGEPYDTMYRLAEMLRKDATSRVGGKIEIEWLTDHHDCETCGSSYAQGARVTLDGETILEFVPSAHCFDGDNWYETQVYQAIFRHIGYRLEEGLEES